MKALILSRSKTGFAERYARYLSSQTGGEVLPLEQAGNLELSQYDAVIFGGGCYAGRISGLRKAMTLCRRQGVEKLIFYGVGATPNKAQEQIETLWNQNLSAQEREQYPHFYMQGGLNYEKMSPFSRFLMKLLAKIMKKRACAGKGNPELAELLTRSYDIWDAKYADSILETLTAWESN